MILACNHISKAFADETVLSDAVFHINEGERAAIVGINGAGKTTLLRIIVGELPADSGERKYHRLSPTAAGISLRQNNL